MKITGLLTNRFVLAAAGVAGVSLAFGLSPIYAAVAAPIAGLAYSQPLTRRVIQNKASMFTGMGTYGLANEMQLSLTSMGSNVLNFLGHNFKYPVTSMAAGFGGLIIGRALRESWGAKRRWSIPKLMAKQIVGSVAGITSALTGKFAAGQLSGSGYANWEKVKTLFYGQEGWQGWKEAFLELNHQADSVMRDGYLTINSKLNGGKEVGEHVQDAINALDNLVFDTPIPEPSQLETATQIFQHPDVKTAFTVAVATVVPAVVGYMLGYNRTYREPTYPRGYAVHRAEQAESSLA